MRELKTSQTVELDEVRANLDSWKQTIHSEVSSLYSSNAVVLVMPNEVRGFLADHPGTPILPGKGVFTKKPDPTGHRKKVRGVACGNFVKPGVGGRNLCKLG